MGEGGAARSRRAERSETAAGEGGALSPQQMTRRFMGTSAEDFAGAMRGTMPTRSAAGKAGNSFWPVRLGFPFPPSMLRVPLCAGSTFAKLPAL